MDNIDVLIKAIRNLVNERQATLTSIEIELNLPRNYLSGLLNKKRTFSPFRQKQLADYLQLRKNKKAIAQSPFGAPIVLSDFITQKERAYCGQLIFIIDL